MNCEEYKAAYAKFSELPLDREVHESDEFDEFVQHPHLCDACSDWDLAQRVRLCGYDVKDYVCVHIANQITATCDEHPDLSECNRVLVTHDERFDEYQITKHAGGANYFIIRNCPWCGAALPKSKRDRWFDELEALGFEDPIQQDIPERYKGSAWYKDAT
jgi:hypothetical protein